MTTSEDILATLRAKPRTMDGLCKALKRPYSSWVRRNLTQLEAAGKVERVKIERERHVGKGQNQDHRREPRVLWRARA